MKRQRPTPPSFPPKKSHPIYPATPAPTSHRLLPNLPKPTTIKSSRARKHLSPEFSDPPSSYSSWESLKIGRSELSLPLTFPTGQTFTWKQTGPSQYTGAINSHLVSLKQTEGDGPVDGGGNITFFVHHTADRTRAVSALGDYLNLGISLAEMWKGFLEVDARFAALAPHLVGARVLRQEPVECLFQFLCSSNNNIGRITQMVGVLSSFGRYLGSVGGFDFHEFPSLERLERVSEEQLRKAGFGYRAKYIVGTVKALQSKPGGGAEWLSSLRDLQLHEVIDALSTLPGVGPKVAACVALFSLDQHHAIPVDTHVWRIATRYLMPELAGARLTPKLCSRVAEAFVNKFGKYAGWAQNVLFIGELPSQKTVIPLHLRTLKERKSAQGECGKQEAAIEVLSGAW